MVYFMLWKALFEILCGFCIPLLALLVLFPCVFGCQKHDKKTVIKTNRMKIRDDEKVASMRSISLAWTEYHTKQAKSQHRQRCSSLVMPRGGSRFKPILGRHLPALLLDAHVGVKTVVTSRPRGHAGGERTGSPSSGCDWIDAKRMQKFGRIRRFSRILPGQQTFWCPILLLRLTSYIILMSCLQAVKTRHCTEASWAKRNPF